MTPRNSHPLPSIAPLLSTVKYSLPELLAELQLENIPGAFVMEKLHQAEIGKLFRAQPKRRRVKSSA
jgi:hypothetical protein